MNRIDKERKTLEAMCGMYCKKYHATAAKDSSGLCAVCRSTVDATLKRTSACPHGHSGNCQDCQTKCQRGENQKRIKEVMRYAAPRMTFRHPLMTIEYMRRRTKR